MNQKELLLLSSRSDDQDFANQITSLFGLRLNQTQSPQEAAQFIAKSDPLVTIVDASTEPQYLQFEAEFQNFIGLFGEQAFPEKIHFLSDRDDSCSYLFRSPIFSNLVVRGGLNYRKSVQDYARVIHQIISQEKLPTTEQLLKKEVKVQRVKLTKSSQKKDVLEAIRQYVMKAGFNSRMVSLIVNATDELLMNAIYDAPKDEKGAPIHAQTPRTASFDLDSQSQVELAIGYDGIYLVITVTDLYGSLDRDELFTLMSKEYSGSEYKLRRHGEGAGLGLATVFRTGASLLFHCIPKKRTEVTLMFKKVDQYKDFRSQMKFVSTRFQL